MRSGAARGELGLCTDTDAGDRAETKQFDTLDELYRLCIEVEPPTRIASLVLWGPRGSAEGSNVAFTFRLMTRATA